MQDIRFPTIRCFNPSDSRYDLHRFHLDCHDASGGHGFFGGSPSAWKEHLTTKTEQLEIRTISDRIFFLGNVVQFFGTL